MVKANHALSNSALSICLAPGIEPATSLSAVHCSTDWASPAVATWSCPAPRKPTTGLELKVAGRCSCSQKCPFQRTGGETWNFQIWWDYLEILNRSKLLLDLLLWRTKLLLSFCSSGAIFSTRVYVLFVSNYFQFTKKKKTITTTTR